MLANTFKEIEQVIETAETPVLVYVTGGNCNDHKSIEELDLEAVIHAHPDEVSYLRFCFDEADMPFPRIQENTLYYFIPKNQTPIFWRTPIPAATLNEDLEVIQNVMDGMTHEEARYNSEIQRRIDTTDSMLQQESKKEFPPAFKQIRNFATDMWHTAKLGMRNLPILVPAEKALERMTICQACDKFDAPSNRCTQCGCNMSIKTSLEASKCPLNKW